MHTRWEKKGKSQNSNQWEPLAPRVISLFCSPPVVFLLLAWPMRSCSVHKLTRRLFWITFHSQRKFWKYKASTDQKVIMERAYNFEAFCQKLDISFYSAGLRRECFWASEGVFSCNTSICNWPKLEGNLMLLLYQNSKWCIHGLAPWTALVPITSTVE